MYYSCICSFFYPFSTHFFLALLAVSFLIPFYSFMPVRISSLRFLSIFLSLVIHFFPSAFSSFVFVLFVHAYSYFSLFSFLSFVASLVSHCSPSSIFIHLLRADLFHSLLALLPCPSFHLFSTLFYLPSCPIYCPYFLAFFSFLRYVLFRTVSHLPLYQTNNIHMYTSPSFGSSLKLSHNTPFP